MKQFDLEERNPYEHHQLSERRLKLLPIIFALLGGLSLVVLQIKVNFVLYELQQCVLEALKPVSKGAKGPHSPPSVNGCTTSLLGKEKIIHVTICPPSYNNASRRHIPPSISVYVSDSLLRRFVGSECSLLINWLSRCSRQDHAGCILYNTNGSLPIESCYKYAKFETHSQLCFDSNEIITYLDINDFLFTKEETNQLISTIFEAIKYR